MTRTTLQHTFSPANRPRTGGHSDLAFWLRAETVRNGHRDCLIVATDTVDRLDLDDDEEHRDACLLLGAMLALTRLGVTRLPLSTEDEAVSLLSQALSEMIAAGEEQLETLAKSMLQRLASGAFAMLVTDSATGALPERAAPLVRLDDGLAVHRYYLAEARVADLIQRTSVQAGSEAQGHADAVAASPATLPDGRSIELNDRQIDAVRATLGSQTVLLSGGPGTGKTTVVVAILRALVRAGLTPDEILLAAPTGRAAWRISESISSQLATLHSEDAADAALIATPPESLTIHRLLRFSPRTGKFRRGASQPIPARAIIIDESSMIPLHLMRALLEARPPDAKLVLIGDPDQLPPVETGAVFADLVEAGAISGCAHVHLKDSYRMSSADGGAEILRASHAVRDRDWPRLSDELTSRETVNSLSFNGAEWLKDASLDTIDQLIDRIWSRLNERIEQWPDVAAEDGFTQLSDEECRALYATMQRSKVLCLVRKGRFGVERINRALMQRLAKIYGASGAPDESLPGRPVIVTRNDYDRGIYNGDTGVVVPGRDENGQELQEVWFPRSGEGIRYPYEDIAPILDPAFAMTVHKSQGSEFEEIILILPDDPDLPLLSRNMIYTGMTRAKRSAVVVGESETLRAGIERTPQRKSSLGTFLTRPLPER